ncbi:MAG: ROK family protein [Cellulomonas sp.]|nr:ROK family protein [Cellulomonas sp.]
MTTSGEAIGGLVVGLDIGGTKTSGVLLGPDDAVLGAVRLPTVRGADGVVATAAAAVRALVHDAATAPDALVGVGIGVPGMVDPATGTVAHAVNLGLPGEPTPLARLISGALGGVRVHAENDLNVAALGAAHAAGAPADLAFLALGTGLAAGLLMDGRLRRGAFGAAGEIGHLPFVLDGPLCACGQRGCLELYASGASLDARWPGSGDVPPPAALFAAAAQGDPAAIALRDDFARAVAAAVRILVLTTDVAAVVLGGGVSELGEPLVTAVRAALAAQSAGSEFLASMRIGDRIRLAPRGVPLAAIGAALVGRGTVA